MTGALSFIGLLLVLAGVERNSGPDKKFVFRHQYLLIEVGTGVLRMVFDFIVGSDFKVYLDNNPSQKAKFQHLLSRNILTPVQRQLLPPIENTPSSDKFDITLLTYLLRNACGLCPSTDQVWLNPQQTDIRVEAYITKFKQCRNDLAHKESVLEDETVLTTKWNQLCMILQGLANYCGFLNLQEEIDQAGSIEIDDRLKEKFENAIKDWQREIDEVRSDVSSLSTTVGTLEESKKQHRDKIATLSTRVGNMEECTKQHGDAISDLRSNIRIMSSKKGRLCEVDMADIRKKLIDAYQSDICSSLPLCPLLENEKGGLLELYEVPTMYVVNYHKVEKQQTDKSPDELPKVKTCSDLFHVKDKDCKNIYLTGDAGVGKTSFCKFLALLWCKSKLGRKLEKVEMQKYIDYLDRFEFVFYINLRDTGSADLKAIVVNQLFYSENKDHSNRMYDIVEEILCNHDSLVIMDGLDEWTPVPTDPTDKRRYEIPVRPISLKCVYLTTCRPYKIENVRLTETNLDHQVKMTGLGKIEIKAYVSNLINIIDTTYKGNKNYEEFKMAIKQVNLLDMLHIPMTTSHLVMLWFDRPLTSMSKSLIYGNIIDMLFKLGKKKGIVIPPSNPSKLKLPERLSELKDFKKHFSQIEQLCLLSYKLLFEHGTDITSLVFTRDQLASEPYCLSEEETNFLCTIGILSKNKVKIKFGKQEHKLSFLHKSYLEFFAAIYVTSLETSKVLGLFSQCRTLNDVLKYKNFLIFYAGLSKDIFVSLMTIIYSLISKDLDLTRVKSIFHTPNDTLDKEVQLISLQDLILKGYIDGSYQIENSPLEDFIFDSFYLSDTKTNDLRKLISSNSKNVRLLRSETGEYLEEFNTIDNLQVLYIEKWDKECCREFIELIKQNKSSLQIISIGGTIETIPSLHLDDLQYLTSLSLEYIIMSREDIQYLTKFLSKNCQLKHVRLDDLECTEHTLVYYNGEWLNNYVCGSFELVQCNKLAYLHIKSNRIVCININTSSLEYIKLNPCTESIARSYINIFNSIQCALELKHLDINGREVLDDYLVKTLITNVQYLSKIETITLRYFTIRDNVSFLLHPSVKQVSIRLWYVNMTARWFQTFIESAIDKHCCITFELHGCIIRQDNEDTKGGMSKKESGDYIHDCIKSKSAIKIVYYNSIWFPEIEFVINDTQ